MGYFFLKLVLNCLKLISMQK